MIDQHSADIFIKGLCVLWKMQSMLQKEQNLEHLTTYRSLCEL